MNKRRQCLLFVERGIKVKKFMKSRSCKWFMRKGGKLVFVKLMWSLVFLPNSSIFPSKTPWSCCPCGKNSNLSGLKASSEREWVKLGKKISTVAGGSSSPSNKTKSSSCTIRVSISCTHKHPNFAPPTLK